MYVDAFPSGVGRAEAGVRSQLSFMICCHGLDIPSQARSLPLCNVVLRLELLTASNLLSSLRRPGLNCPSTKLQATVQFLSRARHQHGAYSASINLICPTPT